MKKRKKHKSGYVTYDDYVIFVLFFVAITFVLSGAILNTLAIARNDGRMPVYDKEWEFSSNKHFTYDDFSKVNDSSITDIFNVLELHFSIGDVLIYLGFIFLLIGLFLQIKGLIRKRKER